MHADTHIHTPAQYTHKYIYMHTHMHMCKQAHTHKYTYAHTHILNETTIFPGHQTSQDMIKNIKNMAVSVESKKRSHFLEFSHGTHSFNEIP